MKVKYFFKINLMKPNFEDTRGQEPKLSKEIRQ